MPRNTKNGLYERSDSPYWWACYTDGRGQEIRCSTRIRRDAGQGGKTEAEAILGKWKAEAHQERMWGKTTVKQSPTYTFDELMLNYIEAASSQKRAGWRDDSSLKHLYPVFTGRDIAMIQTVDVRQYRSARQAAGAAASTINKEVGLLSIACNFARREWGWPIHNPAQGCKLREPEGRVRWITPDEAHRLISVAVTMTRSLHLADLITLALHTGMRRGELLGLEWNRVDLQAKTIYLEAMHTKTGKRRAVPLNREALRAIRGRLEFRKLHCPFSQWVFSHKSGERITDIKNGFKSACRKAEIDDFRFHDLRHTFAAWAVSNGVPLPEVRDLLGHASIEMTERYAHLAPENLRSAVTRLEAFSSRFPHATQKAI